MLLALGDFKNSRNNGTKVLEIESNNNNEMVIIMIIIMN